jgi:hypothetical protein
LLKVRALEERRTKLPSEIGAINEEINTLGLRSPKTSPRFATRLRREDSVSSERQCLSEARAHTHFKRLNRGGGVRGSRNGGSYRY